MGPVGIQSYPSSQVRYFWTFLALHSYKRLPVDPGVDVHGPGKPWVEVPRWPMIERGVHF